MSFINPDDDPRFVVGVCIGIVIVFVLWVLVTHG